MDMSNKQIGFCLIAILGLLQINAARAAVVGFDPVSQTVVQGNTASVDLVISGLGADILSGFDLEISYDDSILSFQSFTVGPGPTGLDPFGLDGGLFSFGAELFPGTAFVQDLSLEPDATLQMFQPDSFILGTIVFDTLSTGTSALTFSSALLAGETGPLGTFPLQADLLTGSITVSAIPVPAAVWLFATGLIGLIGLAKRNKPVWQA